MNQNHFVQSHPCHVFSEDDRTDYASRDRYFIRCLKAMEVLADTDAYIIDYKNRRILYATRGSRICFPDGNGEFPDFDFLDRMIVPEDLAAISVINSKVYDFFYSLPIKRRIHCYFTQDFRIRTASNRTVLINHKGTALDMTQDGALRLTLCVISYPTHDKPGNSYLKMTDNHTVYEFIKTSRKFVEVKTQKLTSKAIQVLKLAGNGKTEPEIAQELGISVHTVKYHKKRIFTQTGARNTAEAIQWLNNQKAMIKQA